VKLLLIYTKRRGATQLNTEGMSSKLLDRTDKVGVFGNIKNISDAWGGTNKRPKSRVRNTQTSSSSELAKNARSKSTGFC